MNLQKIRLTALFSLLITLGLGDFPTILNSQLKISSVAVAQVNPAQILKADRLFEQGLVQLQTSQFQAALQSWQQALIIYREIKDRQSEGKTLGNMGDAYNHLGNYAKAIEYEQQSLAIAREIKDRQSEEKALGNLGFAYDSLGNYAKAFDYYQQVLAIAREIKDRQSEGKALGSLGLVYYSLGDYAKTIEYEQQWLAIAQEIKDRQSEGQALGNLGIAYYALGDYAESIKYEKQWLAIAQEIKDRQSEGKALGNLGVNYRNLGDYAKAIDYHQERLAIAREIKDRQGEGAALGHLGSDYDALGDYAKAIDYHQQDLAITREIKDRKREGIALNNLGLALYKQGNFSVAEPTLFESIKVLESLRSGLDDSQKVSIFETQTDTYITLQQVLIAQNKSQSALEVAERGRTRAFVDLLASHLSSSNSVQPAINLPNIQEIKQIAADQNATIIEYSSINNKFLYIWTIKPNGEIIFRSVDVKSLNTNLTDFAENTRVAVAISRGLPSSDSALTNGVTDTKPSDRCRGNQCVQQMYQLLIKPIADLLPTNPNDRVIFIPHQSLFLIPFAALQDEQGKYLIEKHTILTAPSIQVLQLTHSQHQKNQQSPLAKITVVGNPIMPQYGLPGDRYQLPPLPGAEREATTIAQILNTKPIIGAQATKAFVTQQMQQSNVIHLATHGLLNEVYKQGLPGAIALTPAGDDDGLLSSSEILDLKLKADLVVLSACNTGRGKLTGDGIIGLSRSLMSAGASSIIVSLWFIDDNSTSFLMSEFYQQIQHNPDKAQALRQAMLTTMKQYPEPKYWAAFTLMGEAL